MLYYLDPWTPERRARMSALHRKRWGAPEGHATVYSIHVPVEHAAPVRYWAAWLAGKLGFDGAKAFVEKCKASGWATVPRLRAMMDEKRTITANRRIISQLEYWSRRR